LQSELSKVKGGERSSMGGSGGDAKYQELLRQHEELKTELREQEEVRRPFPKHGRKLTLIIYRLRRRYAERLWSFSIK
jgi:hypothetical protein